MYEAIPSELKTLPNWICWKAEFNEKKGKIDKIPVNPLTGGGAMSNNPDTWTNYETAVRESEKYSGIGFMFGNCDYFGVDIDGIQDELQDFHSGGTDNIVSEFVETLQSYCETSQSGNGIHIICKGHLPKGGRRKNNVEMYESGRFFVMTGNICAEFAEINECTELIKPLHEKYIGGHKPKARAAPPAPLPLPQTASEIVELAENSKNGDKFKRLYSGDITGYKSQSEAELAFCNSLAFWTGRDAEKMDSIFRSSGLMRDKWDEQRAGRTYGQITIEKAIFDCDSVYSPQQHSDFTVNFNKRIKLYSFDDTGNAQRFIDLFGDQVKYCYKNKEWLYYDGRKWCVDDIGMDRTLADEAVENMKEQLSYYIKKEEDENIKDFKKTIKSARSYTGKSNFLKEAMHYVPILPTQLDSYPMLLNTPSGIVNLEKFTLQKHNPDKLLSKITNVEFTDNSDCPQWLSFLNDIFGGDKELIHYIQKAVGYSLTGSGNEQCVFFLYGTGRNGKSTFLDVIREIFGDYAANIQPETIMVKSGQNSAANSDIARLKGARFVTCVEPNKGARLNEGLIKQLTGGDPITARKLYGDEFEFIPEFKLWMATNYKPKIYGTDTGIWRRIHIIPFTIQIPDDKVDKNLKYKLSAELPGILRWAVEGCRMWQDEGLEMPQVVLNEVKEYRNEMDIISTFIDECCEIGNRFEIKSSEIYQSYKAWAKEGNEAEFSQRSFSDELSKRFNKVKSRNGIIFKGIRTKQGFKTDFNT